MTPLALILFSIAQAGQEGSAPDQGRIDQLITDLGASDPQVREQAESQLKTMGRSAVPALREAARSDNAERAMKARQLLLELARDERGKDHPSGERSPAPRMTVVYDDWSKGLHFMLGPDGSVELRAPEKDDSSGQREYRTYRAASLEEFKKKYPELAEKYRIDQLISVRDVPLGDDQLRDWLGLSESDARWKEFRPFAHWLFEGPREEGDEKEGRRFGILVGPLDPALASHLGLKGGEGLLVRQVEPGSLAETSGVKAYDIITKFNGEKVEAQKIDEFRKSLRTALGGDFTLDVIRNGKPQTIRVKAAPDEKNEEKKEKTR